MRALLLSFILLFSQTPLLTTGAGKGGTTAGGGAGAVATDNFNRADADPDASGNWAYVYNSIKIVSNACQGHTAGDDNYGKWVGTGSFNNDQYSQAKLSDATLNHYMGVGVRMSGTDSSTYNGYLLMVHTGSYRLIYISTGGTWNYLINETSLSTSALGRTGQAGDVVKLSVTGTTFTITIGGVVIDNSHTDSNLSTGKPFVYVSDGELDDWEGGNS